MQTINKCRIWRTRMPWWLVKSTRNKFRRSLGAQVNSPWSNTSNRWSRAMRTSPSSTQMGPKDSIITKLSRYHRLTSSWPMILLWEVTLIHQDKLFNNPHKMLRESRQAPLLLPPKVNQLKRKCTRWKSAKRYSRRKSSKESKRYRPTLRLFTCTWRSCSSRRTKRPRIIRCSRMRSLYRSRTYRTSFISKRIIIKVRFLNKRSTIWSEKV